MEAPLEKYSICQCSFCFRRSGASILQCTTNLGIGSFIAGCAATVLIAVLGAPLTKIALALAQRNISR